MKNIKDRYPMQFVLNVIPIEWLRLKVNFLTFNQPLNKKFKKQKVKTF